MTARELMETCDALGVSLIGRKVDTEAIGEWPGGIAEVYAMNLDENAPEIIFHVRHPEHGEMGVFDFEEISLAPEAAAVVASQFQGVLGKLVDGKDGGAS